MRGIGIAKTRYRILALAVSALLMLQVFLLPTTVVYADDNTYASGTLIIPMDTTYQNLGMWRAYGLVYNLLSNGVPVSWAIKNPKSFNETDFTAATRDLRTNAVIGSYAYAGGPFLVSAEDAARAIPIIQAWWGRYSNLPVVHEATASFVANVDIVMRRAPRIANELTNSGISMAYYNAAGIPDDNGRPWSSASPNLFSQTRIANGELFFDGPCSPLRYDIFVTPHNGGYAYSLTDPTNLGTRTYAELDFFTHQGGGWIACCHSIISNEAAISNLYHNGSPAVKAMLNAPVPGGMLTRFGLPTRDNVGGIWEVYDPRLPLAQATPTVPLQTLPGGSMQTWNSLTANYYDETERVAGFYSTRNGVEYDFAINGVAHDGSTQGKITFLGGHSYSTALPYSGNATAMYLRFFFNALFYNSVGVPKLDLHVTPGSIPQGRPSVVTLELLNSGSATAKNTGDVEIFLPAGLTYEGMEWGPAPLSVTGDSTTGITLSWGSSLGDIDGDTSVLSVRVGATPAGAGELKFANYTGTYGDAYGERFRAEQCRAIIVYAAPIASVTKTPAEQTLYSGTVVTWTITYGNPGAEPLYNTMVEDILPACIGYRSSAPSESVPPVVLPDGKTRVRWYTGTLAPGESRTITITAFTPRVDGSCVFTNTVALTGVDANGYNYRAEDTADVTVIEPPIDVNKTVSPLGAVDVTALGEVLTYTLRPHYTGNSLLTNALVADAIPQYTGYVAGSITGGGTYGFTPLAKEDGVDPETFGAGRSTTVAVTMSPTVTATNGTVTATMVITNNSNSTISNIVPSLSETLGETGAIVSAPSESGFTLLNGQSRTVTFTCQMVDIGSRRFISDVSGVSSNAAVGEYDFVTALSNTVLVVSRLNASPAADVVTWRLGSNTAAKDGIQITGGNPAGVYAFYGNDKNFYYRYNVLDDTWTIRANALGTVKEGGSLAYDGGGYTDGYIYGLRGDGSNAFWRYDISANTWLARANTPANVKNGGALVFLNGMLYALGGNGTTSFWRYNPTTNAWTATGVLANAPLAVKDGGAMTTDGTNIYAFRGDRKTDFWRYNVATNTWTTLSSPAANVGQGGALQHLNGYIYAFRGDGKRDFWRYDIAADTWSAMALTPANVKQGGAMTTDGTNIYATQGDGKTGLWRYNVATNTWSILAPAVENIGWGGALAYVPPENVEYRMTHMDIDHSLVTTGDQIELTMTIGASIAVTDIPAPVPVITGTNGASATLASGPILMSTDDDIANINDPVIYRWIYTLTAGTSPGSVTFSANATGSPAVTFPTATSQSILVSPELTFQVKITGAATLPAEADRIVNTGMLSDRSLLGYGVESNTTITPLNRPYLTLTKTNSPDETVTMSPGDEITYTLVLKNEGIGTAQNLVLTDAVPVYTSFVSGSVTVLDNPQDPGRSITVTEPAGVNPLQVAVDYLDTDESVTVTFRVVINTPAMEGAYQTPNVATVSATGVAAMDSNTVYNNFEYYVPYNPSFAVSKTADYADVDRVGQLITYTVYLVNTGDVPLSSVTVDDPMLDDLAYAYGDENGNGLLDLYEQWVYIGTYVVQETDVDENGEGELINVVTADTAETDEQTADFEVHIHLAKTRLTLTKTVNYAPNSGYGPVDAETVFTVHLRETSGKYATDLLLKAGEAVELEVPTGIYEITEPGIPFEYQRTGTIVVVYGNGVPGSPFSLGEDNLVALNAYRAEIEITNVFVHIPYFHALHSLINFFSSPGP